MSVSKSNKVEAPPLTETSHLLLNVNNNDGSSSEVVTATRNNGGGRWGYSRTTVLLFLLITIIIIGFLVPLMYEDFIHTPRHVEDNLINKYAAIAESSINLLNNMTTTTLEHSNASTTEELPIVPSNCESTVLIIRHCEDLGGNVRYEDGTSHCSYLGFQRSLYLATLFGNTTTLDEGSSINNPSHPSRWPLPSYLFGMWNQDGTNKRQYEILRPLSDKSGVTIDMIEFDDAADTARSRIFQLLSTGKLCNRVAVIAWKHKYIRHLAAVLGCDQEQGCPGGSQFAARG